MVNIRHVIEFDTTESVARLLPTDSLSGENNSTLITLAFGRCESVASGRRYLPITVALGRFDTPRGAEWAPLFLLQGRGL